MTFVEEIEMKPVNISQLIESYERLLAVYKRELNDNYSPSRADIAQKISLLNSFIQNLNSIQQYVRTLEAAR